jgi:hypothetical protein
MALQDYLVDARVKEGRPSSQRSEFEVQFESEHVEKEGMLHPDFFDINIKSEAISKEIDLIKKRLDERKKFQIKHAIRMNRKLTKEQDHKKDLEEREKCESTQGGVTEDSASGQPKSSDRSREEDKKSNDSASDIYIESGDKFQDDTDPSKPSSSQSSKDQPRKPFAILSKEEIKDKLDKNIEEINAKMDSRMRLTKKLIYRNIDSEMMYSLSKALMANREKSPPLN